MPNYVSKLTGENAVSDSLLAWRARFRPQDYAIVFVTLALFTVLSIVNDAFATPLNLLNLGDQNVPTALIACGETFVIISGSFDLSVGAIFALAGVVAALVTNAIGSPVAGVVVAVGAGLALGVANGGAVVFGRVHSFIATLATQYIYDGLAIVISGGAIITVTVSGYTVLGQDTALGIRFSIWIVLGVLALTAFVLSRTVGGRYVHAAGGNAEAARRSGVRVSLVTISTFALSGALAALAGVIASSRIGTAQASTGTGLALAGIATTVLGGTSIFGGEGAIWRTAFGVLLVAMIGNGFNLLNINTIYQLIAQGILILIAVAFDAYTRRPH